MQLGVPKGRAVGVALAELVEWQLEHTEATQQDAERWLRAKLHAQAPQ